MSHPLQRLGFSRSQDKAIGIYSICSAHPIVLEAAVRQAVGDQTPLLVEATCNQVNQFGGYTHMRAAEFRNFVTEIALRNGLNPQNLILGGDHLGPSPWQNLPAEEAMRRAEVLVAEYSRAGFFKIHLDASMACAGEAAPLPCEVVAERAARLCRVAEDACGDQERVYVIGTEVPTPGGSVESMEHLSVTSLDDARHTLQTHYRAFVSAGLSSAWPRVIALVVQPGVEFNHDSVADYVSEKTTSLRQLLVEAPGLVFEAHSTDYQKPDAYSSLVRDGFAILKVGPALTFALREAIFSLARIEEEIIPPKKRSDLLQKLDRAMVEHPEHWRNHYHGDARALRTLRRFSYSDRVRYYWAYPTVQTAVHTLLKNLEDTPIPEPLLSFVLPDSYKSVRSGALLGHPHELIVDQVRKVLKPYAASCYGF